MLLVGIVASSCWRIGLYWRLPCSLLSFLAPKTPNPFESVYHIHIIFSKWVCNAFCYSSFPIKIPPFPQAFPKKSIEKERVRETNLKKGRRKRGSREEMKPASVIQSPLLPLFLLFLVLGSFGDFRSYAQTLPEQEGIHFLLTNPLDFP